MAQRLLGWLAGRGPDELADALRCRPDLVVPAPRTLEILASRACAEPSLRRAVETLDAFSLQVLDGLLVLGRPAGREALAALFGGVDLEAPLDRLRRLLLVWGEDADLATPRSLAAVRPHPAGLGRPVAELRLGGVGGAGRLANTVAGLGDADRALLQLLDREGPRGRMPHARETESLPADAPSRRLLEAGLIVAVGPDLVELPREVGLALRGPHPLGPARLRPETPRVRALQADDVDRTGAQQATETLRLVDTLLTAWERRPAPALKAGGLGVRELRALARELGQPESVAALVVEVAYAADLVDHDFPRAVWAPTPGYDAWLAGPPAQRWAALAAGWLDSPRLPALVGARDEGGRTLSALGPGLVSWSARDCRRALLASLAELPAGSAADAAAAGELLAWRAPLRASRWEPLVGALLVEAGLLGICGRDALTRPGRALLDHGAGAAAELLAPLLPEPVGEVVLQADLTAVAPGPLTRELGRELDLVADVESAGAATVYRFSAGSLRRALDAGWSAADLLAFLERVSATPVPQPLAYLVGDVARRYGVLRAGSALSYLRSEDTGLLAEVSAARVAAPLRFRRLAPTVLVSPAPAARVLEVLRAAGYAPVAESAKGVALAERRPAARTPARPKWAGPEPEPPAGRVAELAARLLAAPPSDEPGPAGVADLLDVLQDARREATPVRLAWTDGTGQAQEGVLRPLALLEGQLLAADAASGLPRVIPLRRVSAALREAGT